MFYFSPGDGAGRCDWLKSRPGKEGSFLNSYSILAKRIQSQCFEDARGDL